jgi:PKD repeat protein
MAVDNSIPANTVPNYSYRVIAANVVGDDYVYAGSPAGFPTVSSNSTASGRNTSQQLTRPATASFTYTPSSGDAPLNVTFTDTSTGTVTGWNWDFGDGNFASDNGKQNPSHVYELPGNYTVTLTAMNTGGSRVSGPSTVNVTKALAPAAPVASFTATPTNGTAPLTVTFNADASTSNPVAWATWRWSFGDGTFSSVKNATHTYTAGGLYDVSLTATNLGGTNVMTRVGYVNVTASNTTSKIGIFRPSSGIWSLDSNGNISGKLPM